MTVLGSSGAHGDGLPEVHRREARAMGSPLRLQVVAGTPTARVDRAWREVRDEFEATEAALSRFRASSEIHRLRLAGGRSAAPSKRLLAALTASDRARRLTGGRFDPRVLAALERLGSRPLAVPGAAGPDVAPPHSRDWEGAVFGRNGRTGPLEVPVAVDFGGIGKGLALRWAARRVVRALGGAPFLLEAGGDLVAAGSPPAHGWRIGVEAAVDPSAGPVVVLELPAVGGAVATSSTRLARWQAPDGSPVHHLIDPATGRSGGEGLRAVTVLTSDPAWAEVWAKALFIEGRPGIAALARSRGLAAWWVPEDGSVEMTPAARPRTIWLEAEAA